MHPINFVFHFEEEKSHLTFYMLKDIFPSTISILRTAEESMPIKLCCFICGRIKDIACSNPKFTDFMFRSCRSLFIVYIVYCVNWIYLASVHSTCVQYVRKCIHSPALCFRFTAIKPHSLINNICSAFRKVV